MYHSVPFDFETMIKVQIDAIKGSLDTPLGDETDAHTDQIVTQYFREAQKTIDVVTAREEKTEVKKKTQICFTGNQKYVVIDADKPCPEVK